MDSAGPTGPDDRSHAPASAGEDILSDAIDEYLEQLSLGQADYDILRKAQSDAVKARREPAVAD